MSNKPTILVVIDATAQREVLSRSFVEEGFDVFVAATAMDALTIIQGQSLDVVVLDSDLSDIAGNELCHRLKTHPETKSMPIILLTDHYDEADCPPGLDTSADDFLVRPFGILDLVTRVRLQILRLRPTTGRPALEFEGMILDHEALLVYTPDKIISLSPICIRLLAILLEKPGRVWRRADLVARVWDRDVQIGERTIDVHIGRLRRAFTKEGLNDPLRTVHGTGYMII